MPRSTTAPQVQATAGELDPMLMARSDLAFYGSGWRRADNVICLPHGASPRRGGGRWAGLCRADAAKLTAFRFAVGDAYWLEWGEYRLRFWRSNRTPVLLPSGLPFELVTPYAVADLPYLRWQRSADKVWFVHPGIPMQVLERTAADTFTIGAETLNDGPYYAINGSATTATTGGTGTGDITVVFNFDQLGASDVGRHFRVNQGTSGGTPDNEGWAWGRIKTVVDAQNCVVTFVTPISSAGATTQWRLGLYSERSGFPCAICIHQQRLFLGSNPASSFPRVDGSQSGNFTTFKPGVVDDEGIQDVVDGDEVPIIKDIRPNGSLFAFTTGGVHRIDTSDSTTVLTPTNQSVVMVEPTGAGNVPTIRARRAILFFDAQMQSVGEIKYDLRYNGPVYSELTVRSAHLFSDYPGVDFEWADKPWGQFIGPRSDGSFVLGTYNPDQETIAPTPCVMGGSNAQVLSVATVPTFAGNEIGLLVDRNGVRSLEVLAPRMKNTDDDWFGVFLDASITYADTPAATLTLQGTDGDGVQTWVASASVFSGGDAGKVIRTRVYVGRDRKYNLHKWTTYSGTIRSVVNGTTITIKPDGEQPSLPTPMASGEWYRSFTTMSGLGHLEGQEVYAWAEGQTLGPFTVSSGAITFSKPICYATAGLKYRSAWQQMPPAPATEKGSAVGRPMSNIAERVRVLRSADLRQLDHAGTPKGLVPTEPGATPTDRPRPLYTGDLKLNVGLETDAPVAPVLVCDGAGPCTVLASVPTVAVGEAG